MSAVRVWLLHIFVATLHIGSRSSIRNLRTRHAVVTGTHLSWNGYNTVKKVIEWTRMHETQLHFFRIRIFDVVTYLASPLLAKDKAVCGVLRQ